MHPRGTYIVHLLLLAALSSGGAGLVFVWDEEMYRYEPKEEVDSVLQVLLSPRPRDIRSRRAGNVSFLSLILYPVPLFDATVHDAHAVVSSASFAWSFLHAGGFHGDERGEEEFGSRPTQYGEDCVDSGECVSGAGVKAVTEAL
ncbi:hypothetical protein C8F04DRAFT_1321717 [Mycena alexandri]|uniref:Uncharacterized protein n=1 Tax=Mycena alexandri TaxID=1745969 RepID=A0AAD6WSN6_9AGAR|nr:hypothetical protein C8F04DRAFT_1321717 [Mycena alexandri]